MVTSHFFLSFSTKFDNDSASCLHEFACSEPTICAIVQYLVICKWLVLPTIVFLSFMFIVLHPFLYSSDEWYYCILCIHLSLMNILVVATFWFLWIILCCRCFYFPWNFPGNGAVRPRYRITVLKTLKNH